MTEPVFLSLLQVQVMAQLLGGLVPLLHFALSNGPTTCDEVLHHMGNEREDGICVESPYHLPWRNECVIVVFVFF